MKSLVAFEIQEFKFCCTATVQRRANHPKNTLSFLGLIVIRLVIHKVVYFFKGNEFCKVSSYQI